MSAFRIGRSCVLAAVVLLVSAPALAQDPTPPPPPAAAAPRGQTPLPRPPPGGEHAPTKALPLRRPDGPRNRPEPQAPPSPAPPGPPGNGGGAAGGGDAPGGDAAGGGPGQAAGGFDTGIEFRRSTGPVFFNLEDADLPDLVRAITSITGRSFIIGGKVRSIKATIYAPTKVSQGEAYRAFLSALDANGLTVVPSGRYLKIVETAGSANLPLPVYRNGEAVPPEDRMVTRVHRLAHVSAEDMSTVMQRFKSASGDVTAYAPTNTLVLTDTAANIRRMLTLMGELDVAGSGQQVWVEPMHYASASDMAARLMEIFEATGGPGASAEGSRGGPRNATTAGGAGGGNAPSTVGAGQSDSRLFRLIPEDRTNSLIIVATERAYLRVLELIRRLDIPMAGNSLIHVVFLQNADAEELANVVNTVSGRAGDLFNARRRSTGAPAAAPGGFAPLTSDQIFEGRVQCDADKSTNALVIIASPRDFASLQVMIQQLDLPRRQVFVEAAIMEVSQSRLQTLGLAFHGAVPIDTNIDGTTGDPAIGLAGTAYPTGGLPFSSIRLDPTALLGLAAGLIGPEIEGSEQTIGFSLPAFGVVLNALQTDNDVNVISTPHILATDNVEAEITVGQNVPVQQGFVGGAGGAAADVGAVGLGGLLPAVNVQRQNVGLTLKLTPHVNDSRQVRLELNIELSEVQGAGGVNPIISQRTTNTQVVVRDQQTVVIGGLVRDIDAPTEDKVPILGDLPVFGYFFRRTQTRREKQNLLIVLTPYIVRDAADLRTIFQRKMQERREFIERYTAFANREPDTFIDYSRTNGLLEEINRAYLEAVAEDAILREAAAAAPQEHGTNAPIEMPVVPSSGGSGGGGGQGAPPSGETGGGEPVAPTPESLPQPRAPGD